MIITSRIARYLLILLTVFVLSIIVTEYYWMAFEKAIFPPKVYYSPISKNFVITKIRNKKYFITNKEGNKLTKKDFERLLPFLTYKQLLYKGLMPDTIQNIPIDVHVVRANNFSLPLKPRDIYTYKIPLAPLIESAPNSADLQFPNDMFRINERIEFIDCETNRVNEEKSKLFTNVLKSKGFVFPAKNMFGNPSVRKSFDEGYFIIDSKDQLFHLKRIKNKPFCKKISVPKDVKIKYMKIREINLKEFYGIVIAQDNRIFILSYDNYKFIELPSKGYHKNEMQLKFTGDLFYRLLTISAKDSISSFVMNRNYKTIDSYSEKWKGNNQTSAGMFFNNFFPFRLSLTDRNNSYINFYYKYNSTFIVNIILMIIAFLILWKYYNRKPVTQLLDLVIILFTGIFGFIAVLLIRDES